MNKQVTFYINDYIFEKFKQKFPNVTSVFLRRCIIKALNDSSWFQEVFFTTSDKFIDKEI